MGVEDVTEPMSGAGFLSSGLPSSHCTMCSASASLAPSPAACNVVALVMLPVLLICTWTTLPLLSEKAMRRLVQSLGCPLLATVTASHFSSTDDVVSKARTLPFHAG